MVPETVPAAAELEVGPEPAPSTAETSAMARRPDGDLLPVEEARQLLAQCVRVDEAKQLRDRAAAVRIYLREQNASREAQNSAAEIKLRAERRLGELLAEQEKNKGGRPPETPDTLSGVSPPTLQEQLGTDTASAAQQLSKRWQDVAALPDETFEGYIREQKEAPTGEVTTAGLMRSARASKTATPEQQRPRPPPFVPVPGHFWEHLKLCTAYLRIAEDGAAATHPPLAERVAKLAGVVGTQVDLILRDVLTAERGEPVDLSRLPLDPQELPPEVVEVELDGEQAVLSVLQQLREGGDDAGEKELRALLALPGIRVHRVVLAVWQEIDGQQRAPSDPEQPEESRRTEGEAGKET